MVKRVMGILFQSLILFNFLALSVTGECDNFDFEDGTKKGWTKTGNAFESQPTYGDNPAERPGGEHAKFQGDWWIGTYENRSNPELSAGNAQGDAPNGTLTSPEFRIAGPKIRFLIGGTCVPSEARVELLVSGHVVRTASPKYCSDTMKEQIFDVKDLIGQTAEVRLVDSSHYGHLNFDDLRGDFDCRGILPMLKSSERLFPVHRKMAWRTGIKPNASSRKSLDKLRALGGKSDNLRSGNHAGMPPRYRDLHIFSGTGVDGSKSALTGGVISTTATAPIDSSRPTPSRPTSTTKNFEEVSSKPTTASNENDPFSSATSGTAGFSRKPTTAPTESDPISSPPSSPTNKFSSTMGFSWNPTTIQKETDPISFVPSPPTNKFSSAAEFSRNPTTVPTESDPISSTSSPPTNKFSSTVGFSRKPSTAPTESDPFAPVQSSPTNNPSVGPSEKAAIMFTAASTTTEQPTTFSTAGGTTSRTSSPVSTRFKPSTSPLKNDSTSLDDSTRLDSIRLDSPGGVTGDILSLGTLGTSSISSGPREGKTKTSSARLLPVSSKHTTDPSESQRLSGSSHGITNISITGRITSSNGTSKGPPSVNGSDSAGGLLGAPENLASKIGPAKKLLLNHLAPDRIQPMHRLKSHLRNDAAAKIHKLGGVHHQRYGDNSTNGSTTDLRNLTCQNYLVAIKTGLNWHNDFLVPASDLYQNTKQTLDVKILNIYDDVKDFTGEHFEKFSSSKTINGSGVKGYVVLKFRTKDKFLTKLLDAIGVKNITSAGCYNGSDPSPCAQFCPRHCAPACDPRCCASGVTISLPYVYGPVLPVRQISYQVPALAPPQGYRRPLPAPAQYHKTKSRDRPRQPHYPQPVRRLLPQTYSAPVPPPVQSYSYPLPFRPIPWQPQLQRTPVSRPPPQCAQRCNNSCAPRCLPTCCANFNDNMKSWVLNLKKEPLQEE